MRRREFLSTIVGAAMVHAGVLARASTAGGARIPPLLTSSAPPSSGTPGLQNEVKPMAIGVMIRPAHDNPEAAISVVKQLGMSNCFLNLDDWIGRFTPAGAQGLNAATPVEAIDMIGPYIRSVHAKDGMWPTNPMKLGREVVIGSGCVDFSQVFTRLNKIGYKGAITIERETSGPQQIEDVKREKAYLEQVLGHVLNEPV
jgi:hypothetical protein